MKHKTYSVFQLKKINEALYQRIKEQSSLISRQLVAFNKMKAEYDILRNNVNGITEKDILELVKSFIKYNSGSLCKHYVCLCLLDLLERKGMSLDNQLVKSISDCDDEKALKTLYKKIKV